mmetsp:Transcript_38144/g.100952  ORF Transcript_38144/g.100952 Transcript_38144/m.100952 type:complete len:236 (+) Transcript_38144:572-1279(+)
MLFLPCLAPAAAQSLSKTERSSLASSNRACFSLSWSLVRSDNIARSSSGPLHPNAKRANTERCNHSMRRNSSPSKVWLDNLPDGKVFLSSMARSTKRRSPGRLRLESSSTISSSSPRAFSTSPRALRQTNILRLMSPRRSNKSPNLSSVMMRASAPHCSPSRTTKADSKQTRSAWDSCMPCRKAMTSNKSARSTAESMNSSVSSFLAFLHRVSMAAVMSGRASMTKPTTACTLPA